VTGTVTMRRCAWKSANGAQCAESARPRKGNRGPEPRWCDTHTAARKRQINHHPRKPRGLRPECCTSGHLCPQHEQNRDEWRKPLYPLSQREAAWLIEQFGSAEAESIGFHVTGPGNPKGWETDRGPDEGRTKPEVFSPDPSKDGEGIEWFTGNPKWWLSGE
jgi:hypothetical protein